MIINIIIKLIAGAIGGNAAGAAKNLSLAETRGWSRWSGPPRND
jgi:hypothetical protein